MALVVYCYRYSVKLVLQGLARKDKGQDVPYLSGKAFVVVHIQYTRLALQTKAQV